MGNISEFSLPVQAFMKVYRWRRIDPVPWTPLKKPLAECKLAVVSSAGLVAPGMAPFDESVKGGDVSFREIPNEIELGTLIDTHRSQSYDHAPLRRDPNLAFPIDRVNELAAQGRIGSVNRRHLSFMGSITKTDRFVNETAPEAAGWLVEDHVDVALLVPV